MPSENIDPISCSFIKVHGRLHITWMQDRLNWYILFTCIPWTSYHFLPAVKEKAQKCVSVAPPFTFRLSDRHVLEWVLHTNQLQGDSIGSKNFCCAWTLGTPAVSNGFLIFFVLPLVSIKAELFPLSQFNSISAMESCV